MSFTFPSLAIAGALLALAPIVIHLLNLRRRRRVNWAAMDFLLQSQRKNRTWVRMSEWLLLALRVIAVVIAGLFAATPRSADLLEGFFGGDRALHIVVLDDSGSMQRRDADRTAWEEATAAITRLNTMATDAGDEVVVLRYTDRLTGAEAASLRGDVGIPSGGWRTTNTAATPGESLLTAVKRCEAAGEVARTYAYVMSDFAERSHGERSDWGTPLARLSETADEVVLAACGAPDAANLAVESVTLAPGPLAAGVETTLRVRIVNHSDEASAKSAVSLSRNGAPLTAIDVGPLEGGEQRVIETPVTFGGVGSHVIEAALPDDRLPIDDRGWLVADVRAAQSVLLVDRSEIGVEARVFAAALRPRGTTRSGWAPRRVEALSAERLAEAAAVFVLDVPRLRGKQATLLADFVRGGGGVLFVLGPQTDREWFNRAFTTPGRNAEPMIPWRLGPATSAPLAEPGRPTVRIADHRVLRVLQGDNNGFLSLINPSVLRRLEADDESPPRLRTVNTTAAVEYETLMSHVGGAPLLLANRYGAGRVLALLTTTATGEADAPPWSNLATLPIFPVIANDAAGWLAEQRLKPRSEAVGSPTGVTVAPRSRLQQWRPGGEFAPAGGLGAAAPLSPAAPGVFRRTLGGVEQPAFAARIAPEESDLRAASLPRLGERWRSLARIGRAEDLFRDTPTPESRGPIYATALALLSVLGVERWLAFRNSYVSSAATGGVA